MQTFETLESSVRSYCRHFPAVFTRAVGSKMYDERGRDYIDFFSGAGTLNYGHNNPCLKRKVIEYLEQDGILHALDMATTAKRTFLRRFERVILEPRRLKYKVQFPGPTGTNAVEAALKLARKVTGRKLVIYFSNAFHGMTLGSLAVTSNLSKRAGAGVPLSHTLPMPFDGDLGPDFDTLEVLETFLRSTGRGCELPAAVIVETVQGEGGVRAASFEWLQGLERLCRQNGILLIVDDIQAGCGRSGTFFSFEPAAISPDLVCLSKSISGLGLPMALVLIKPSLDVWNPGEHNGTFRGNNLAFVAAAEALRYWEDDALEREVCEKAVFLRRQLGLILKANPRVKGRLCGRGLMQGITFEAQGLATKVAAAAFERGLIIETAGPADEVLKLLPPLVIDRTELKQGLEIIEASLVQVMAWQELLGVGDDLLMTAQVA